MSAKNPIIKNVLHAGQKYIPIADGSKAHFHFQTWKLGKERILIDDSKKIGKKEPMVLVIGHKFKLEVWETIVKLMAVGEVASFRVKKEPGCHFHLCNIYLTASHLGFQQDKFNTIFKSAIKLIPQLVYSYPFVSKTLRDLDQDQHQIKHTCTMTLHTEGIGYSDLDDLIRNPCDLEFIIELLKVERSDEYEREVWQLDIKERLELIPTLKDRGNKLYAEKKFAEAENAYSQAIAICEQLMLRERKTDEEWITLNKIKLPILLNYAQVKLVQEDFYAVIEHCNTILEHDKDNEKALYRRAKAHVGAWNPDQAEEDFKRLKAVNPTIATIVDKELEAIKKLRKEKAELDKDALKKLFLKDKEGE